MIYFNNQNSTACNSLDARTPLACVNEDPVALFIHLIVRPGVDLHAGDNKASLLLFERKYESSLSINVSLCVVR